jgi:hypothetical protein
MPYKLLKPGQQKVLSAVIAHMVPETGPRVETEQLLNALDGFLFHFPSLIKWGFLIGTSFFNWRALVTNGHSFTKLPPPDQKAYILKSYHSHLLPVREWIRNCANLVMFCYYQHPEVVKSLGCDPERWAELKIQQRKKAMNT